MSINLHRKLLPKICKPKDDDCHDDDDDNDDHHDLSTLQVLMICTLAVLSCFVCYIIIVKTCRALQARRRRGRRIISSSSSLHGINNNNNNDNNNNNNNTNEEAGHQDIIIDADVFHPVWLINTVGLDQSVIDSIQMFKYIKEHKLINDSDCSVCLGVFQENESLRLLPKCSHAFHVVCIDTWLRSHKNCPVCRAPVVVNSASVKLQTDPNSFEEEIPRRNRTIENARELIDANGESSEFKNRSRGFDASS